MYTMQGQKACVLDRALSVSDDCFSLFIKVQLQRFPKLVSYERAAKILQNDICITEIGQAILEIFEFKVKFP